MNIPFLKIIAFFLIVLFLGWMLYPRDYFLAYISEGQKDIAASERYYLEHLQKHPFHVESTKRLALLYQKTGEPHKAYPMLEKMLDHRFNDWDFAQFYLKYITDNDDQEELSDKQIKIAKRFLINKNTKPKELIPLLEEALNRSLWRQNTTESYNVLKLLQQINPDPNNKGYLELMIQLNKGLKNIDELEKILIAQIKENPKDIEAHSELATLYQLQNKLDLAKIHITKALELDPQNYFLMQDTIEIYVKLGELDKAIHVNEALILNSKLTDKQRMEVRFQLAQLLFKNKKHQQALDTLTDLRIENPNDISLLRQIIGIMMDMKSPIKHLIGILDEHLKQQPDDLEMQKTLVNLYLYDLKDASQQLLFMDYVQKSNDWNFAKDVAYLLLEQEKYLDALSWTESLLQQNHQSVEFGMIKIECLTKLKEDKQLIQTLDHFLSLHPNNIELLLRGIEIHLRHHNKERGKELLLRLANVQPNNFETQLMVAKELYYLEAQDLALDFLARAEEFLNKANSVKPTHRLNKQLEINFYNAEILQSQKQSKHAQIRYKAVLETAQQISKWNEEQTQQILKAQSRIEFSAATEQLYQKAKQRFPKNPYIRLDFLEFLLDDGNLKQTEQEMQEFETIMPAKHHQLLQYPKLRLAVLKRDWKQANLIVKNIMRHDPQNQSIRLDFAEISRQLGQWPITISELEKLKGTRLFSKDVKTSLNDLHLDHDNKISEKTQFTDFGTGYSFLSETSAEAHLSRPIKLKATYGFGQHDTGTTAQITHTAELIALYQPNPSLLMTAGPIAGFSSNRSTAGFKFETRYTPLSQLTLGGKIKYRGLRQDLPQSVTAGSLHDEYTFNLNFTPTERILLAGQYEFDRSYLPNGATAKTHKINPTVNLLLLRKPYITLGYQFLFSDVADNGFIASVPLVPKQRSHYLTAYVSHNFTSDFSAEAGFFIGEDTARNLRIFEADMFGFNTKFNWHITPWLHLSPMYSFGRENLSTLAGQNHQFEISITGHWPSHVSNSH